MYQCCKHSNHESYSHQEVPELCIAYMSCTSAEAQQSMYGRRNLVKHMAIVCVVDRDGLVQGWAQVLQLFSHQPP